VRFLLALLLIGSAHAHELRPGFLEVVEKDSARYQVFWKQPPAGGVPLELTPVFPATCQQTGQARGLLDAGAWQYRTTIRCAPALAGQTIAIEGLEAFPTDVLVRVQHASGAVETHLLKPERTSITLGSDAAPQRTAFTYLFLGIAHIATGFDHLMFVLGLLLIVRSRWVPLLKTITAFTLSHSISLAAATLGVISLPSPPVEAAIALSILFLGPEIVRIWRGQTSFSIRHPWAVAFIFGLLHGFGFASGLTSLGLPHDEIPLALLLFNLGVEIGQVAFVAAVLALERASRALQVRWPASVLRVPGYVVGTAGAFWTISAVTSMLAR
jgi:hydrogenase/urease accessory protein HupE